MEVPMNQTTTYGDLQLVQKDGQAYQLPYGMSFIGREECDITLQSHSADKRHAVIFYDSEDKEVRIKDLNSITGTYVNSVRIPEQSYVKLKHLDCIRFGYGSDLFYIQKVSSSSALSNNKDESESCVICNEDKITEDTVAKCTVEIATIEQNNCKESESNLSLHEVDSLEDIRHSLSGHSPYPYSPTNCELNNTVEQNSSNSSTTKKLHGNMDDSQTICENSKFRTSDQFTPIESANVKESAAEQIKQNSHNIKEKEKQSPGNIPVSELCNGKENKDKNSGAVSGKSDTSESSPIAMAFTIAFDTDIPAPRKKLGIKDSISQYAPRKIEAERNQSQKQTRSGKGAEQNLKKVHSLDGKDAGIPIPDISKRWNQESMKQIDHPILSRSMESTLWDLASKKEEKEKSSPEGKLSEAATFLIQKMLNGEPKSFIPSSIPSPPISTVEPSFPRTTNWSQNWNNSKNQMDGIMKSPPKNSPTEQRLKSPENKPISQREIDDKSETGTYTVEADQTDPIVEEARLKIDEIFGVRKNINDSTSTLNSTKLNNWYDKEKDRKLPCSKEQNRHISKAMSTTKNQGSDASSSEGHIAQHKKSEKGPQRPKRRLPTPPVPKQLDSSVSDGHVDSDCYINARLGHYPLSLAKKDKEHRLSNQDVSHQSQLRQCSAPFQNTTSFYISSDGNYDRRTRLIDNVRSQKAPLFGNKSGLMSISVVSPVSRTSLDSSDSQAWSNMAQQDSCQNGDDDSLDGTGLSHYTPSDTRSEGSPQAKTPQSSSGVWRRIPWNLSSSDLELNRSKSETASVVSDLSTSTEPSSLSSQYSKGKSDSAPPMRLNRAFALRRARLGIESDSAATTINKNKENIKQSVPSNKSHLNPAQLSRQDGGRFSLRLPRKAETKSGNEKNIKSKESKKKSASLLKNGHRRIESDPGKANTQWKKMEVINDIINSDVEVSQIPLVSSPANQQTFHRSASFNGAEELLCANNDNSDISNQKTKGRPNQLPKTTGISQLRKYGGIETARALGISPGWQHSSMEEKESEKIVTPNKGSPQHPSSSNKRELSALDSLVISAIHQLSVKLRTGARCLLEKERQKHTENSDISLMIEEVLPQVIEKKSNTHNEGNLTRDLSSILKNLKRVEQSLEVLSSLADYDNQAKGEPNQVEIQKFFVVNV